MDKTILFDKSDRNKFFSKMVLYNKVLNEIYNNPENRELKEKLTDSDIRNKENSKLIKEFIETRYKKEWEQIEKGDFSPIWETKISGKSLIIK